MRNVILILCFCITSFSYSQFTIQGKVTDEAGVLLSGVHIDLDENCTQTTSNGSFELRDVVAGTYVLRIQKKGFQTYEQSLKVVGNNTIDIVLFKEEDLLPEMIINDRKTITYNSTKINQHQIKEHFSGSLAKSLEHIPGVNAMEIGSGVSKPVIRGLGFNRIAVAENGIKQEGQQWGADHGLEIDALQTEEVEVIKGVGAIEYGSDAIGGVIKINNEKIPQIETTSGSVILHGKTVNEALGLSANIQSRGENYFYKLKFSGVDYADFKVPAHEIYYLNTKIPIENKRMKNTAGDEYSFYAQGGYVSDRFQSIVSISNLNSKIGFFPGAHGIPSINAVKDDGDSRNIDFPYQKVNHFKVINSNKWINDHDQWDLLFSFQQNHRQEWSAFHTHYSNQSPPLTNPDLELDFVLNTLDTQLKYTFDKGLNHKTTFGLQQNYQENQVGGYSYLLPEFTRNGVGFFAKHEWKVNELLKADIGLRLDYAHLKVKGYFDPILYDYLKNTGKSETESRSYAQRSTAISNNYLQPNIMVGLWKGITDHWTVNFTAGTNFRFPSAMELSANGIHHGAFRHERGNPDLDVEKGLSSEIVLQYESDTFKTSISPYVYYFSNYIFLKPTGVFSVLPHGGQVYEYSQSRALITGFEWNVYKRIRQFSADITFEYLYNKQLSDDGKDYPLPFTTPVNLYGEFAYHINDSRLMKNSKVYLSVKWANAQNRIAQNEEKTSGYTLLGGGLEAEFKIGKLKPVFRVQASNLLDTKYFNHSSFYRAIEIPELGRNVQLMLQLPF